MKARPFRLFSHVATVLTLALFCSVGGCDKSPTEPGSGTAKPAEPAKAEPAASSAVTAAATPSTPPAAPPEPKGLPAPSDVASAPADAKKTASGLALKVLTPGKGKDHPGPDDKVTVHYTGWTTDGKMFDSSVTRGEPASFGLNGVIKGWTEGVQLMVEGEKTRFWIPAELAYGSNPRPGAPSGQLTFDIELLSIE
jgi:FKBP-type peptidyl-prolyl cis-trans isomerase